MIADQRRAVSLH